MSSVSDIEEVAEFVRHHRAPRQISLSAETHLFHFHDLDWRKSPVVLVNKNGNHTRIIRDGSQFKAFKTWAALFGHMDWQILSACVGGDIEKVLARISSGPGTGRGEFLSLFPKDAFGAGRRKACWRSMVFDVTFGKDLESFTLKEPVSGKGGTFNGKVWESAGAVNWCAENFPDSATSRPQTTIIENPFERKAANDLAILSMQDNPLFGAFG